MLKTLRTKKAGAFTLVEIMIVVAIIALLASIAVPNFLRSRQRSQATRVLEDARVLDAAKDQWAIERNKAGTAAVVWDEVSEYLKDGSPLAVATDVAPEDIFGNAYAAASVNETVKVDAATIALFSTIIGTDTEDNGKTQQENFWGAHLPAANP